jgi:hypothetical protein
MKAAPRRLTAPHTRVRRLPQLLCLSSCEVCRQKSALDVRIRSNLRGGGGSSAFSAAATCEARRESAEPRFEEPWPVLGSVCAASPIGEVFCPLEADPVGKSRAMQDVAGAA